MNERRIRLECFAEIPQKPEMVIISGASGAGKGTIVKKFMELSLQSGEKRTLSRSWTTREQRPGEHDDAYNFVSRDEFEQRISEGGFLEFTEFLGNYYGTPKPDEESGQLIAEIETNGAQTLKLKTLDIPGFAQFQYVLAINPRQLEAQLVGRSDAMDTETKQNRLKTFYEKELAMARGLGAHVIINTSPDLAAIKSLAAANGVFFCDPTLAEVVQLYEDEKERRLADVA